MCDEWLRDSVLTGALPEGTTLETLKREGLRPLHRLGDLSLGLNRRATLSPDETHATFRWHVEKKLPYPRLTRRAQFYIDHDWFLEAGEELPTHKENPKMGGDHPFQMTSGHNRWSIHSHEHHQPPPAPHPPREGPTLVINTDDAQARGASRTDDEIRVWNDMGAFFVPVKVSPSVRPGQVIVYNGWEPYMFRELEGARWTWSRGW